MPFAKADHALELHPNDATTPVPPEKLQAMKGEVAHLLDLDDAKAELFMAGIFGGRKYRTGDVSFGSVHALNADRVARIMGHPKIDVDEFEVGFGAAENVAKMMKFIGHPSCPICDHCGQYPIGEEGDAIFLRTDGPCPKCETGLIRPSENQAKPYRPWTRPGVEFGPRKVTDDEIMSATATCIPTTNDGIKAWQPPGDATLMTQLDEHGVEPTHFCAFLFHGPLKDRFTGPDDVLDSLSEPRRFGARDERAIRQVVLNAKDWEFPKASAPTPMPVQSVGGRVTMSLDPGLSPESYLSDLFQEIFEDEGDFRRFMNRYCREVNLRGSGISLTYLMSEAASSLRRHGYLNLPYAAGFFNNLRNHRPLQTANINYVAGLCGIPNN